MKTIMKLIVIMLSFLMINATGFSQTDTTRSSTAMDREYDVDADVDIDRERDTSDWNRDNERTRDNNRDNDLNIFDDNDMTRNTDKDNVLEDFMADIHDMHENMLEVELTGNFDVDFAKMMIEHHQGAIELSETFKNKSDDEQLEEYADMTIDRKKGDIGILKDFNDEQDNNNNQAAGYDQSILRNAIQDKTTAHATQLTGDVNKDYVNLMAAHHEKAIQMAKLEQKHGNSPYMKDMATKMILDSQKELGKLTEWQRNH